MKQRTPARRRNLRLAQALLGIWKERYKDKKVSASRVFRAANKSDKQGDPTDPDLHDAVNAVAIGRTGRPDPQKFGIWLASKENRVVNIADEAEEGKEAPEPDYVMIEKAGFTKGKLQWRVASANQPKLI